MSDVKTTVCLLTYNETTGEGPPGIDCGEYLKSIETILTVERYGTFFMRYLTAAIFIVLITCILIISVIGTVKKIIEFFKTYCCTKKPKKVEPKKDTGSIIKMGYEPIFVSH